MSIVALSLVLMLAVALIATPGSARGANGKVCFTRSQHCCYEYSRCGVQVKRKHGTTPCPYKNCKPVCRKHCSRVRSRKARRTCHKKRVRSGRKCYHDGRHRVCKPHVGYKKYCKKRYVYVHVPHCTRSCTKSCKVVHMVCRTTKVYNYPKFCPSVQCSKLRGGKRAPGNRIGKRGKVVRVIKGSRIRRRH
eukprot:IDg12831t1